VGAGEWGRGWGEGGEGASEGSRLRSKHALLLCPLPSCQHCLTRDATRCRDSTPPPPSQATAPSPRHGDEGCSEAEEGLLRGRGPRLPSPPAHLPGRQAEGLARRPQPHRPVVHARQRAQRHVLVPLKHQVLVNLQPAGRGALVTVRPRACRQPAAAAAASSRRQGRQKGLPACMPVQQASGPRGLLLQGVAVQAGRQQAGPCQLQQPLGPSRAEIGPGIKKRGSIARGGARGGQGWPGAPGVGLVATVSGCVGLGVGGRGRGVGGEWRTSSQSAMTSCWMHRSATACSSARVKTLPGGEPGGVGWGVCVRKGWVVGGSARPCEVVGAYGGRRATLAPPDPTIPPPHPAAHLWGCAAC
jgi:hypothetical protein